MSRPTPMDPTPMPKTAKLYITVILVMGCALIAREFLQWASPDVPRYLAFLALGLISSTRKVRLPGITGSMSMTFLFILMGITQFTLAETVGMGCAAALIQCFWKVKRQPAPVQVAFNVAAMAISIVVAYLGSRYVLALAGTNSMVVLLALAACIFFLANTGLVTTVIALVEGKAFREIWDKCYSWAFPYYLVGASIAGLISSLSRTAGWGVSLLVLPVMYLIHISYGLYIDRATLELARS